MATTSTTTVTTTDNDNATNNKNSCIITSPTPSSSSSSKIQKSKHPSSKTKSKSSKKQKQLKKRFREIEKEAALRTLNGNGCDVSLPPLPSSISDQQQQQQNEEKESEECKQHPYGVLPHGNIYSLFLDNSETNVQLPRNCVGPHLSKCNDLQLISICSFLSGTDLGNFVCCSRFCYVLGHLDELWRDLTLRTHDGGKMDIEWVKNGGWRDTFVRGEIARRQKEHSENKQEDEEKKGKTQKHDTLSKSSFQIDDLFVPHEPMQISHIYSDTFYRPYLCRTFPLPKAVYTQQTVPTFHYSSENKLSIEEFLSKYEETNTPLLIKGATASWPAFTKWKDTSYLEKLTTTTKEKEDGKKEKITFRATSGAAPLPASFTLPSYLQYCNSTSYTEELPLYLFDRTFVTKVPQLERDYMEGLHASCPFWDHKEKHHDLLGLLGERKRPDYRWLIIGPKRSGSSFHIDPNATHAWNAPLLGRKHWIFYPPGVTPPGIYPSPSGDDVAMPISIGEWFLAYYTQHETQHRCHPDKTQRPIECIAEPGDILFVPHGWWHAVLNIDDGASIALTSNYVSASNVSDVLRFFEYKQSQISGCRDRREEDAIQPEEILEEFSSALKKERREIWDKAVVDAKKGWKCCAWTDDVDDDDDDDDNVDCCGINGGGNNNPYGGGSSGNNKRGRKELEGASSSNSKKKKHGTSVLDRARMPQLSANNENSCSGSNADEMKEEGGFRFSFAF